MKHHLVHIMPNFKYDTGDLFAQCRCVQKGLVAFIALVFGGINKELKRCMQTWAICQVELYKHEKKASKNSIKIRT